MHIKHETFVLFYQKKTDTQNIKDRRDSIHLIKPTFFSTFKYHFYQCVNVGNSYVCDSNVDNFHITNIFEFTVIYVVLHNPGKMVIIELQSREGCQILGWNGLT